MTSFFISDIHLSESNNKLSSAFINFLKDSKESCSQLFILGDLFEVWIGDDYETSFINDIKSELLNFTTNGPDTFLNESSVKKIIDDYSPDIFIHGHTHRPNIHEYASSKRIVLGDWDDFGWYLRLDDESYNLEKFSIA